MVKKGDIVQYVPYSMARMPFIWGSDALELKPERWLKDGVFQSVSPFKFTTFQVLNPILLFIATFQNLQTWGADAEQTVCVLGKAQGLKSILMLLLQAGPRICLGRDSAFLQLKVTLSLIIHFFTFQLVPGQELTYTSALVMPMKNGVQVTISPRQK